MATANLVLRFIVELLGIVALGYAGFQASDHPAVRVVAAIAGPAILIVIWAVVVAPNATNGLAQPQRDLIGTVLLLLAAGALAVAGQSGLGIALAGVVIINTVLLFAFGHDATAMARQDR